MKNYFKKSLMETVTEGTEGIIFYGTKIVSTDFLRKQPWHKEHLRLIYLLFRPITVTKNGQVRGIYYDRNNRWRNGRASISPTEHDRSSRLALAATVNRACRQPEILTNHTEKERDGLLVPRIMDESVTKESASVHTRKCVDESGEQSREATEETEDLSRWQFGLTDLIRLGRERCDASIVFALVVVATTLTAGRLHCARHSSSALSCRVSSNRLNRPDGPDRANDYS